MYLSIIWSHFQFLSWRNWSWWVIFNSPDIDWDSQVAPTHHGKRLLIASQTFGWTQIVPFETRGHSTLDLIFLPVSCFSRSVLPVSPPSVKCDHNGIFAVIGVRKASAVLLTKFCWKFCMEKNEKFLCILRNINQEDLFSRKSANEWAEIFEETLFCAACTYHQYTKIRFKFGAVA